MMQAMDKKRLITSIVLVSLSVFVLVEASKFPFGTLRMPHAGFWPMTLGILLAILSVIHLVMTLKRVTGKGAPFWSKPGEWKKVVLVLVPLLVFCFFFERLGFLISTFLLLGFLLRVMKPLQWWRVLVIAGLCSILTYFIFKSLLGVQLPAGLLGF